MGKKKELKKQYKQLKKNYMQLQEDYAEARGYLYSYSQELLKQEGLLRYQHDYIHWKSLDEEFPYSQENAHEEVSDWSFPHYVM